MHSVRYFGGSGECCSGCDDLDWPHWDNDYFTGGLHHTSPPLNYEQVVQKKGSGADGVFSTAWTNGTDANDPSGTDFADVVFYSGHGWHDCTGAGHSRIYMGQGTAGTPSCNVDFGGSSGVVKFGNSPGEASILILAACQSAHYCVWQDGGYAGMRAGSVFTTHLGFHGDSYDASSNTVAYGDHPLVAWSEGIGDLWVDFLTTDEFSQPQCATAIIWGASSSSRADQYYHGGFKDFHSTGAGNGTTLFYPCSCNPNNGDKLPSC